MPDNRQGESANGTCESDELADQPTTMGGQAAIAWSWRCPNSYHAAVNAIGQGMHLRLQVNVPLAHSKISLDLAWPDFSSPPVRQRAKGIS